MEAGSTEVAFPLTVGLCRPGGGGMDVRRRPAAGLVYPQGVYAGLGGIPFLSRNVERPLFPPGGLLFLLWNTQT